MFKSTFTQKYVKYMFIWKIILSMIEAHNMMYSILQHSLPDEISNTSTENTSKNTIPKVFLVKHNYMYYLSKYLVSFTSLKIEKN